MRITRNIVLILIAIAPVLSFAQSFPQKPNPPRLVNDLAEVLSADEEARLERKLVAYDDSTSNQIVILTIRTLEGFPIEEFALRVFRDWQIGNKTTNNGVLILAIIDDRQVRIEVGYGLEGAIPDITANQIIRNDIAPNFRSDNYYEGFEIASQSVIQAAAGEYKAPEGYRNREEKSWKGFGLIAFIIIIIVLSSINRRGGGGGGFMSRRGYRGMLGPTIFGSILGSGGGGWGGGGGGGWSGGGGFGGFGGGSSGGGGASGSW